jgi:hypothetical protein
MLCLCGYSILGSMLATARTGFPTKARGDREARYFRIAKEDLDGSEAR